MNTHNQSDDEELKHRCLGCGKLLAIQNLENLGFDIKCLRCGKLNTLFHKMEDQLIITDEHGKILFANDEVSKITGFGIEEIIGKTPGIWGGQMSKEFYQEMWRLISVEKKSIIAKVHNKHKSGSEYDAMLRISPIQDTNGNIKFFVGIETIVKKDSPDDTDWSLPKLE